MQEPMKVAPPREVWIHDNLGDETRRRWEQMAAELR